MVMCCEFLLYVYRATGGECHGHDVFHVCSISAVFEARVVVHMEYISSFHF